jgi:hypothetical protein
MVRRRFAALGWEIAPPLQTIKYESIRDKVKMPVAYAKRPFRSKGKTRKPLPICCRGVDVRPAGGANLTRKYFSFILKCVNAKTSLGEIWQIEKV